MKICSIHIKGFQQFEDLYLDFTNPDTGEPVDKVCFIGRNGTGKSTLLRFIESVINNFDIYESNCEYVKIEIKDKDDHFYLIKATLKSGTEGVSNNSARYLSKEIDHEENWEDFLFDNNRDLSERWAFWDKLANKHDIYLKISNKILKPNNDLLIVSPVESNTPVDFSKVVLSEALGLFKNFPYYHLVSHKTLDDFWRLLIFLTKNRESEKELYENNPENIDKTKRQLNEEFDKVNPRILDKIAELWNKILDRAGLEFDVEGAKIPVQLNDNLQAYIRHKKTKEVIHYSQLSTGIRNFIFRIGHIYSLYFNREIKRGFLLVDEPENSLFPDFLFELMELYDKIIKDKNGHKNTQMFFATHSPIVAAQFEPYERIVLEWDDEGHVTAHKGKSPVGDDPNDILVNDFQLDHLMGTKGQEMWNEYLRLRKELRHAEDPQRKEELLAEIHKIGTAYNFDSKNKYEIPR